MKEGRWEMEARKLQTSEIGNDTRSLIYDIRFHDLRFIDNHQAGRRDSILME